MDRRNSLLDREVKGRAAHAAVDGDIDDCGLVGLELDRLGENAAAVRFKSSQACFSTGNFNLAQGWFRLRLWNEREREGTSPLNHGHCISSAYIS